MTVCSIRTMLILLAAMLLAGCASTPEQEVTEQQYFFESSLEDTRSAAVDALTVLGFEIEEQTDAYIRGHRPHKVGLFVGSGGETVGIWLQSISEGKTGVKVDTAKSFVGHLGQKDWDDQVLTEMKKSLAGAS